MSRVPVIESVQVPPTSFIDLSAFRDDASEGSNEDTAPLPAPTEHQVPCATVTSSAPVAVQEQEKVPEPPPVPLWSTQTVAQPQEIKDDRRESTTSVISAADDLAYLCAPSFLEAPSFVLQEANSQRGRGPGAQGSVEVDLTAVRQGVDPAQRAESARFQPKTPQLASASTRMRELAREQRTLIGGESEYGVTGPHFNADVWKYYHESGGWSDGPFAAFEHSSSCITCCFPPLWFHRLYVTLTRAAPVDFELCGACHTTILSPRGACLAVTLTAALLLAVGKKYGIVQAQSVYSFLCKSSCCPCLVNARVGLHVDRAQGFHQPPRAVRDMVELSDRSGVPIV